MDTHDQLHVGAPNIGNRARFFERIDAMFDRRWLTNRGELVQDFEHELADYLGVKHCIPICNGTTALEIAARALDLTGEVIVPSFTFVATAHALKWLGLTPVFCDIDRSSYCIDPAGVEQMITPRTSAILGVHLFGRPCDIDALHKIAVASNIKLMFDAAHAFSSSYKGTMIGNFGECEVLSFHATKFFNTFEGGAIATNSDDVADKVRLLSNFGFRGMDNVVSLGINGKMTEVCAAMGLTNLESLDEFLQINKRNYDYYMKHIAGISGLTLIEYDENERSNWQYIVIEVGDDYPLSRDALMDKLHANNIRARRYFYPGCHRMEPYRSFQTKTDASLLVTDEVADRILVLPTGSAVTPPILNRIIQVCSWK